MKTPLTLMNHSHSPRAARFRRLRRLPGLALALLLALSPAMPARAALPGVDASLSDYLDINSDVRFAFSAQLESLLPYGESTIAQFNGVLKHLQMSAALVDGASTLTLCVDHQPVLELTGATVSGGTQLTTPLLPNRELLSEASALNALLGASSANEAPFDALLALREVEACYKPLTDAIAPMAEEKKSNYKIKSIGTARWSRIARLTPEQSDDLLPLIAQVLGCGMDAAYRNELSRMTCGKGFIVGLYQTEQGGADLAVYMKGDVTFADGSARRLSYQWATTSAKGIRTDTYKFELTTARAPKDDRVIAATYKRSVTSGAPSIQGDSTLTLRTPEGTTVTKHEHDLSGREADGARTLVGTASTTVKIPSGDKTVTTSTVLTPNLTLTSEEGSGVLSGTVGMAQTEGKNTVCALTLTFDSAPAERLTELADSGELFAVAPMPESSLTQNAEALLEPSGDYLVGQPPIGLTAYSAPSAMRRVELDSADPAQLEALRGELYQNLAGKLLIALASLPEEDRALLSDNMSNSDFATFLQLVKGR